MDVIDVIFLLVFGMWFTNLVYNSLKDENWRGFN
jgi:hypothetical protein